jgi:hypothetical protein
MSKTYPSLVYPIKMYEKIFRLEVIFDGVFSPLSDLCREKNIDLTSNIENMPLIYEIRVDSEELSQNEIAYFNPVESVYGDWLGKNPRLKYPFFVIRIPGDQCECIFPAPIRGDTDQVIGDIIAGFEYFGLHIKLHLPHKVVESFPSELNQSRWKDFVDRRIKRLSMSKEERQQEIDSFLDRVSGVAKECFLGYEDEDEDEN